MAVDCAHVGDLAAEFALGGLDGDDRAAVIAHLETCAACSAEVAELTAIGDELLLLVPPAAVPAGFEDGVLRRLAVSQAEEQRAQEALKLPTPRRRRRRIVGRRFALASVAVTVAMVGVLLGVVATHDEPAQGAAAVLSSPAGAVLGHANLAGEKPALMALSIDGVSDGHYTCFVKLRSGVRLAVGSMDASNGRSWWDGDVGLDAGDAVWVSVVDAGGHVVAGGPVVAGASADDGSGDFGVYPHA